MNKSYHEICATSSLLSFEQIQPNWFVETWLDEEKVYACHWLTQNERILPSTIKQYDNY